MRKFFSDFKTFLTRGNVIDLAIAVVIGGAFGKIVTSLVNDIIMPIISLAVGGVSVAEWKWVIKPQEVVNGVVTVAETSLNYGLFIQAIIDFLIIAFFIFLALRLLFVAKNSINGAKDKLSKTKSGSKDATSNAEVSEVKEEQVSETTEQLLTQIRDLLKEKNEDKK